jgi:vacuolar protein sorting-associated protein 45
MILFDSFLKYGGTNVRGGDLFGEKNGLKKFMKAMTQGVQGVPNVYAQHVPPLMKILDQILKGHLLDTDFGIVNGQATPGIKKVKDIIIFICGGVTFEEAQKIAELNQKIAPQGQKIIIGGTFIHNSTTFLQEVGQCFTSSTSFTSSTNRRASSYTTTR